MQHELSELLGRDVDLHTPASQAARSVWAELQAAHAEIPWRGKLIKGTE